LISGADGCDFGGEAVEPPADIIIEQLVTIVDDSRILVTIADSSRPGRAGIREKGNIKLLRPII
jgi:hypothetical protein